MPATRRDVMEMVRLREVCYRSPSEIASKFGLHPKTCLEHIRKYNEGIHPLFVNEPKGGFQVFHMPTIVNRETNY